MGVMIQIRNVPPELHKKLKAKAAAAGMSLSEYLLREVEEVAARPSLAEMLERLSKLPPIELPESAADIIREMRGPI